MAEKLVRDNVVYFSLEKKDGRRFRIAKPEELPSLLSAKLKEECDELIHELMSGFGSESKSHSRVIEEMVDLLEVIETIQNKIFISDETLSKEGSRKRAHKGGFERFVVMEIE